MQHGAQVGRSTLQLLQTHFCDGFQVLSNFCFILSCVLTNYASNWPTEHQASNN